MIMLERMIARCVIAQPKSSQSPMLMPALYLETIKLFNLSYIVLLYEKCIGPLQKIEEKVWLADRKRWCCQQVNFSNERANSAMY